ncbi:MAG: TonB-dependent receptor, partial [Planctomycetes bacterium]|nr:TonB-dependent receptor [Planctomycetota bacterium]
YADSFALATRSNDTYWSGDATLEYRPAATTLLYLTLARGAKPGGVNTGATSSLPLVDPRFRAFVGQRSRFDTETVFNKEIGLKGRYLDERLTVRLAAFHMDRSNAQLESWLWDANNFIFVGMLDNVDDAENYGVELESRLAVTRQVTFDVAVGYLETNVESMQVFDLDLNAFRTLRDRDQAKAPRWQYHFGLRWRPRDDLDAGIAVEGRDDSYIGYYHDARLDAWTVLNADVAWRWRDAELRVWARNLLNTEYAQHGLYFANDPRDGFAVNRRYLQFAEPRVYGVEINYEF